MQDALTAFEDFLNERMKDRGMTTRRLAELSGIPQQHLEYLVRGEFNRLPAAPYIRGYLVRIAPHLEFNPEEWWEHLKKSPEIKSSGEYDALPRNRFASRSIATYLWIGGVAFVLIFFVGLRLTKILGEPVIHIASPAESFVTTNENHFLIVGAAENTTSLTINGESVALRNNNQFEDDLALEPGLNTIVFIGKKFLGGESTVSRQIFSEWKPTATSTAPVRTEPTPATSTTTSTAN